MRVDWRQLVVGANDVRVAYRRSGVEVLLGNGRRHVVRIAEDHDGLSLEAVVAGAGETAQLPDACKRAWRRNRRSRVVGYRVDARRRF